VTIGNETHVFVPGTGMLVARGTPWRVDSADGLRVLSVLVEEPLPAGSSHSVIVGGERGPATAGRESPFRAGERLRLSDTVRRAFRPAAPPTTTTATTRSSTSSTAKGPST
jgi:hypothetical protein